jgi:glucose/mannose transport system substrate-binding protein
VTQIEVVSWWTTGGEASGFNAIIDKFNADNPTLHVTNSAIAGGAGSNAQAALQNRVLAGTPPDSFQVHMGHELLDTYVTPGYMDNLDDLYTANGWTTQFPKGVLDIVSAKDASGTTHYYSVPLDIHRANVLWYNKTVFSRSLQTHALGMLATLVALSLGSPFWFDALAKLVNVRMAGSKPGAKPTP